MSVFNNEITMCVSVYRRVVGWAREIQSKIDEERENRDRAYVTVLYNIRTLAYSIMYMSCTITRRTVYCILYTVIYLFITLSIQYLSLRKVHISLLFFLLHLSLIPVSFYLYLCHFSLFER